MKGIKFTQIWGMLTLLLLLSSCISILESKKNNLPKAPEAFQGSKDTMNSFYVNRTAFFHDPYLNALIDTALENNQEINILLQEVKVVQNEVLARKGAYIPFVNVGGGMAADKVGRYTSQGASDAMSTIAPGKQTPEVLGNFIFGANIAWEVDIWRKLRNARDAAMNRYLATEEGKNFAITTLVAEIAQSYYELLALDNQLEILQQNIEIQKNALEIVRVEKIAARVTELAVKKFEAEVFKNQSHVFHLKQQIIEIENRINFLVGRYPQPIQRNALSFSATPPDSIYTGVPSQLLANRPDIRRAEQLLKAYKLDVQVAKADFYPSLFIDARLGFNAFNPKFLISSPESMIFSMAGNMAAPVINRKAIQAAYLSANARQIQAMYLYEQTVLRSFIEVVNQWSNIANLKREYELKAQQVDALNQSIAISTALFRSARADYMEVLLTQRDALESKFDLIETRMLQYHAWVEMYRALGGGR